VSAAGRLPAVSLERAPRSDAVVDSVEQIARSYAVRLGPDPGRINHLVFETQTKYL
jgi:hypothetical protein